MRLGVNDLLLITLHGRASNTLRHIRLESLGHPKHFLCPISIHRYQAGVSVGVAVDVFECISRLASAHPFLASLDGNNPNRATQIPLPFLRVLQHALGDVVT